MRILAVGLIVMAITSPALAGKRISVDKLDQAIAEAKNKPDQELARWLLGFELTERVSTQRSSRWKDEMPGKESSRALAALVDSSAFLKLPAEEIPATAPMDSNAQRDLLALTSAYVEKTLSKLPNFFATQSITTFEDTPASQDGGVFVTYAPLHYADFKSATVYYRGNKEVMETKKGEVIEDDQTVSPSSGLLSSGEFGPVLNTLMSDSKNGKLNWSHWETMPHPETLPSSATPIPGGTAAIISAAVFSYVVPRAKSHYKVKALVPWSSSPVQERPGYRGEIAIDPSSGAILRVTLKADLNDDDVLPEADLMVEYGSVEIGAKQYLCPVKSIAFVRAYLRTSKVGQVVNRAGDSERTNQAGSSLQTILNDVAFVQYHLLRSEAKMLTGADTEDDKDKP